MNRFYVFIFVLLFALFGCAETTADNEIIWHADLNHDGNDDIIKVEILTDRDTGEGAKMSVYTSDLLIYSAVADLPHVGWNGIYLFEDESGAYLLIWQPSMGQGAGHYTYEIFSFDEKGNQVFLDTGSLVFEMRDICDRYEGLEDFVKYMQRVNDYLASSSLIVDTHDGTLLYGTQENPIVHQYTPKWLFNVFQ